jgi:nickel/cobalt exporter
MLVLLFSSLSVGIIHTLLGPDHYLPFIVLARSRSWSTTKTMLITLCCGLGHILSAVVLGMLAVSFGLMLNRLDIIESFRGEIAAWLLIGFGFAYGIWGIRQAVRTRPQLHLSLDDLNKNYVSGNSSNGFKELIFWILFIIFVLGPCEPLIPLIMYPVVQGSLFNTILVTLFFSVGTLGTMLAVVLITVYSTKKMVRFRSLSRFGNALAGMVIGSCGLAIKFLGV